MKCLYCGAELENGSGFCGVCGNPVYSVDTTTVTPTEKKKNPGLVLGIISMALSIISLLIALPCSCCLYTAIPALVIGAIFAIVGLILAIIGKKKSSSAGCKNAMAVVGIILSIITLVCVLLSIIGFILMIVLGIGGGLFDILLAEVL